MNNNNFFPNPNQFFMNDLQAMRDRIDNQMRQIQQQQQFSTQQQPQIQQTFQLSNPTNNSNDFDGKYAENSEEVKSTLVLKNSLFVSKDMQTLWVKDVSGGIKTYSLSEIIEKDEKDIEIDNLRKQIEDMKFLITQQGYLAQQNNIPQSISQPISQSVVQPTPQPISQPVIQPINEIQEQPEVKTEKKTKK